MERICINCRSYRQKEHWSKGQCAGYCIAAKLDKDAKYGYLVDGERYAESGRNGWCDQFEEKEA